MRTPNKETIFQCGSGEMGTLYWSKNANPDELPAEMVEVPKEIFEVLEILRDESERICGARFK